MLDLWHVGHLAGYFSVLTCQCNITDVRATCTVVFDKLLFSSLYSFHVMVNSVSCCCVHGSLLLSNPIINILFVTSHLIVISITVIILLWSNHQQPPQIACSLAVRCTMPSSSDKKNTVTYHCDTRRVHTNPRICALDQILLNCFAFAPLHFGYWKRILITDYKIILCRDEII